MPAFIVEDKVAQGEEALRPETREVFMNAIEELRAAGATVVFDDSILPASFLEAVEKIKTWPYHRAVEDEGLTRILLVATAQKEGLDGCIASFPEFSMVQSQVHVDAADVPQRG